MDWRERIQQVDEYVGIDIGYMVGSLVGIGIDNVSLDFGILWVEECLDGGGG